MIWEEDKDKRSESDLKEDSCIGCMGKINYGCLHMYYIFTTYHHRMKRLISSCFLIRLRSIELS